MVTTIELKMNKQEKLIELRKEYEELGYRDIFENLYNAWTAIGYVISSWYRIKYPDYVLEAFQKKYVDNNSYKIQAFEYDFIQQEYAFMELKKLSKHMGYKELMLRIPKRFHSVLECEYKNKNGKLYLKNTNNKVEEEFSIDESGYFKQAPSSLENSFNCEDIETLYRVINKENYDLSEMEKIIQLHNLNLKFRVIYLESIAVSFLRFLSHNQTIDFVRAKLFIEEFNKYIYDLNLDENIINNKINEDINKDELNNEINYMLKELKNEEVTIEDFGLTFNTLKILEFYEIRDINDIKSSKFEHLVSTGNKTIWNYRISNRDIKILGELFHKFVVLDENYDFGVSDAFKNLGEPKKKRKLLSRK